jgi:hypothetical protein
MTHALRGGHIPGRGDLTGARIQALAGARQDRDTALANTRNALVSDPVTTVSLPGGRSYLIPVEVVDHLLAEGRRSD